MASPSGVYGLAETLRALRTFPEVATQRNTLRRALVKAAEPIAVAARALAPDDPKTPAPDLKSSIMVATQLTKRHRKGEKENEVEVYVGPTRVPGRFVLNYASFAEYGTANTPAHPYLRPAWEQQKGAVMEILARELRVEFDKTAARLSRKAAKLGR